MDDRAVSPVIGVILMVAMVVILAATLGAFILDLSAADSTNDTNGTDSPCDDGNETESDDETTTPPSTEGECQTTVVDGETITECP